MNVDDQLTGLDYDVEPGARRPTATGFLLDSIRRRPAGRRLLSALTGLLFVAGIGLFTYPFFTDVYTNNVIQSRLADEFDTITVTNTQDWKASVDNVQGAVLTRLAIPSIELETLVVEGTSPAALRAGAGHYPNTPLPGEDGNVAIAGHRTTYGRPFNRIDEIRPGDEIWLSTPVGDYLYVAAPEGASDTCQRPDSDFAACITTPSDWGVISPTPEPALTLTSCHPKGSAQQRIVLRAHLVDSFDPGTYVSRRDAGDLEA